MSTSQVLAGVALLVTASIVAKSGFAQVASNTAATGNPDDVESIIVTGSRIQSNEFEAPTPVTSVGLEKLESDARPDIGDVIRELPAFGASTGPSNSVRSTYITDGSASLNLVSLRNLGTRRTLVLFNGQRVVDSNLSVGGVDLSTIPSTLVKRVDVVTGGASAAWGSNAVAGVVNIIIDNELDGFKAHLQAQNNWDAERQGYQAEAAYGTRILNDRGHILVGGSVKASPDTFFGNQIDGNRRTRIVENPAYTPTNGEPRYIHADNVGPLLATPGGIITDGPLKGIYFVGPDATPHRFDYGNISRGSFTWGGTPNYGLSQSDFGVIANPTSSEVGFGQVSYDLTDSVTASVQLNHGHFEYFSNSWTAVHNGSLTITADNPFIPPSVREAMEELGITSFPLGTTLTGDVIGNGGSVHAERYNLGMPIVDGDRRLNRGVVSLDGVKSLFGTDWTWNAYYQYGEAKGFTNVLNNPQTANIREAVDAVLVTPENVGTSGLPIGSIVCRSTLTDPDNQCQPLDVFGTGKDVSAAAHYINIAARNGENWMRDRLTMSVFAASASGKLPFGLPAGEVATAFGAEYRKETGKIIAGEAGKANLFYVTGNHKDFYGTYSTKEAFVEFNIPILSDQVVQSLDLSLAGRYTDYSVSGEVNTYKIGFLSQLNDALRVRTTFSRDIRAPGLFELFNKGQLIGTSAIDPRTGQQVSTFAVTQGNINLTPEIGETFTIGAIVTPDAILPNLTLSVDWWRIKIDDVITTASQSTTIDRCMAGEQVYCDNLVFDGPNGALSRILLQPINAAFQKTVGVDFSVAYGLPVFAGDLDISFLGTYLDEDTLSSHGVTFNAAGSIGGDSRRTSEPRFKGALRSTYSEEDWSITAQARIIGRAKLNKEWGPQDIDRNKVPTTVYVDLRGSMNVSDGIQLYAAVDNVLDKSPPVVTSTTSFPYYAPFRDATYDVFGRVWRAGVRLNFD